METRHTILARSGQHVYTFTSYKNLCKAAGIKTQYPIPEKIEVDGFGILKIESAQLNVSFPCLRLRRGISGTFQLVTDKLPAANGVPARLEHTFIVKDGMYYVVTNADQTKILRIKHFQKEIPFDEATEQFILKRFNP